MIAVEKEDFITHNFKILDSDPPEGFVALRFANYSKPKIKIELWIFCTKNVKHDYHECKIL